MLHASNPILKSTVIAATLALSAFSFNAQAQLISYSNAGVDLVHSSVSNVTWTKDGNLLGSLFASQGFNTVVNNIIAASPTITHTPAFLSPPDTYTLTASDFSINGQTSWFGAMAFINYLNSKNYGGSNQWYLPSLLNTSVAFNPSAKGNEFAELYYRELYLTRNQGISDTPTFDNEQSNSYWYETEYANDPSGAWLFFMGSGGDTADLKTSQFYAWAVSPGRIATTPSAVPVPAAAWLFGSGLVSLAGLRRRKQAV